MLEKTRIGFGAASHSALAALEGLLLGGLDDHPLPKLVDDALHAGDDDYISARNFLAELEPTMFRPMVGRNFIDSPNWPTLALVTILVLRHVKKSAGGFTVASILTRIPFRDGFDRLARHLRGKMTGSGEGFPDTADRDGGSKQAENDRDH